MDESQRETEKPRDKSLIIFGRDVSQIPCFRNSFLYGTLGGLGFGLAHFMFTSKVGKSANYSVYAFSMITIGYWIRCRYEFSRRRFEMLRVQRAMEESILAEGTELDPRLGEKVEIVEVIET